MGSPGLAAPIVVDQLLHGYSDGHRLIAASESLAPAESRRLLVSTDVPGGPDRTRVISSLPLPESRHWALTATWSADEMPRPGSVWSHTLLFDEKAVAAITSWRSILDAFERPTSPVRIEKYTERVVLGNLPPDRVPRADLVEAAAFAFYGWPNQRVAVLVDDLGAAEEALLALWCQQWAGLRMTASFATRSRVGSASVAAVQMALSSGRAHDDQIRTLRTRDLGSYSRPTWLEALTDDVLTPGPLTLFLERYGGDTTKLAAEVPTLVRAYQVLHAPHLDRRAFSLVADSYPARSQMTRLKWNCLRRGGPEWLCSDEAARINAALANLRSVQWEELDLPRRIADLASDSPMEFEAALLHVKSQAPPELRDAVFETAAASDAVDASFLAALAKQDVQLAAELARRTPVVGKSSFWQKLGRSATTVVRELVTQPLAVTRLQLALALVEAGATAAIRAAVDRGVIGNAELAAAATATGLTRSNLAKYERLLGDALDRAVEEAARPNAPWQERVLAAASSSSAAGELIHRFPNEIAVHMADVDEDLRLVLAVKMLGAARHPRPHRDRLIAASFGPVHRALVANKLPPALWKQLDPVLPVGNDWDRAERLRMLVLEIFKQDGWKKSQLAEVLRDAGPHTDQLRDLVDADSKLRSQIDAALKDAL